MISHITTFFIILLISTVIYLLKQINDLKKKYIQQQEDFKQREQFIKKDAKKRSGAVKWGLTIENFVPFMSEFPIPAEDVHFLGKPIDYVGYTNINHKDKCEVHFIEVKSGKSQLLKHQTNVKHAIQKGRVKWHEVRVDSNSNN